MHIPGEKEQGQLVSDQKLFVTDTGQKPVSGSVNDCVPMISGQDKVDLRHLEV